MNFWLKTPLCTKWLLQLKTGSNCQQFRACGFDQFGNEEQNISQHKCLNAYLVVHVICPQFTSKLYEPQLNMQPYLIVSGLPGYFHRPVARLLHLLLLLFWIAFPWATLHWTYLPQFSVKNTIQPQPQSPIARAICGGLGEVKFTRYEIAAISNTCFCRCFIIIS